MGKRGEGVREGPVHGNVVLRLSPLPLEHLNSCLHISKYKNYKKTEEVGKKQIRSSLKKKKYMEN